MTLNELIREYPTPLTKSLAKISPPPPTGVLIATNVPQTTEVNADQQEIAAYQNK